MLWSVCLYGLFDKFGLDCFIIWLYGYVGLWVLNVCFVFVMGGL